MKAYAVQDDDEGQGDVVFARNPMEARRLFSEQSGVEQTSLHARRTPEFDDVEDIDELRWAQLVHGWWFTCGYCDARVEFSEEDTAGTELDVEVRGEHVYCNGWHAGAAAVRQVDRRIKTWEAIEKAEAAFPGAVIDEVNLYRDQARVWLRIPPLFEGQMIWVEGEDFKASLNHYGLAELGLYLSGTSLATVAKQWLWKMTEEPVPSGGLSHDAVAATAAELRCTLSFGLEPSPGSLLWLKTIQLSPEHYPFALATLRALEAS